jgi:hypothetical protein
LILSKSNISNYLKNILLTETCWYHLDKEGTSQCDICLKYTCEDDLKFTNRLTFGFDVIPHRSDTFGYFECPLCEIDSQIVNHKFTFTSFSAKIILLFLIALFYLFTLSAPNIFIAFGLFIAITVFWVFMFYKSFIEPSKKTKLLKAKKQEIYDNPEIV